MEPRFEPDDPLLDRPEPEYVELIDPDPPPPIPSLPSTYGGILSGGGRLTGGVHTPGTASWRRWVAYVVGAIVIVGMIVAIVAALATAG